MLVLVLLVLVLLPPPLLLPLLLLLPASMLILLQPSLTDHVSLTNKVQGLKAEVIQVRWYWIVRLSQTLRYHAQMVYPCVCVNASGCFETTKY